MTSRALTPEEAQLARRTRPLTEKELRDIRSRRRFDPREGQPAVPEPNGQRVASILSRLAVFLDKQGVFLNDAAISNIAQSEDPWRTLSQYVRSAGAENKLEEIEAAVRQLHEEDWRIGWLNDGSRLAPGIPDPDDPDDATNYAFELNRLIHEEGLSDFQAHQLLAEWGFRNPFIPENQRNPELESLAAGLAVMRAAGEYTGEVEPFDILTAGTLDAAMQLLEEAGYSGALADFDEFQQVLITETGLEDTVEANRKAAAEAAVGRPELPSDEGEDLRRAIKVPIDFVARAAPRPPGPLRGSPRGRAGLDQADAEAVAASGPRGGDLAFAGRGPIEQPPEYFEGDEFNIFNGLSFEQTMLYQTMLVDAGWLDPDDFAAEQGQANGGFATWEAMNLAMAASNRTIATSWIEAAQQSAAARERNEAEAGGDEPVPVWTPGTYLAPDPDYLSQVVKQTFRSQLGREPSAAEVAALMASLSGEFRGAFDVEETKAQAEFEQGLAAQEASFGPIDPLTGERTPVPLTEEEGEFRTVDPTIEALTGVDPIASFAERFEARFAEELARGRYREVAREARGDIMGSIFATDRAVGGGR